MAITYTTIATDTTFDINNLPTGWGIATGTYNTVIIPNNTGIISDNCVVKFLGLNLIINYGTNNDQIFRNRNNGTIQFGELENETEFLANPEMVTPIVKYPCNITSTNGTTVDIIGNRDDSTSIGTTVKIYGGFLYGKGNVDIRTMQGKLVAVNASLRNVEIWKTVEASDSLIYGLVSYDTDYSFSYYFGKVLKCMALNTSYMFDNRGISGTQKGVYRGVTGSIRTALFWVDTRGNFKASLINCKFTGTNGYLIKGTRTKTEVRYLKSIIVKSSVSDVKIEQIVANEVLPNKSLPDIIDEAINDEYASEREVFLNVESIVGATVTSNTDFKIRVRKVGYKSVEKSWSGLTKYNIGTVSETFLVNLSVDNDYDSTLAIVPAANYDIDKVLKTIIIKADMTMQELYNVLHIFCTNHLEVDNFELSNGLLNLNNYSIVINANVNLFKTDNINKIEATTITIDGSTDVLYKKDNGKVNIGVNISIEPGISNTVYGVWLKSQGLVNRAGIITANATDKLELEPNIDYYIIADGVNAIRSKPMSINTGSYGVTVDIKLVRIKKIDGSNLLPDTLASDQQYIADMFNYDQAQTKVTITLPSDYKTNFRWDSASKNFTLTSDDCVALEYKAEQIQSGQGSLKDPTTVGIRLGEMVLESNSSLIFIQASNNDSGVIINMTSFAIRREADTKMLNTFIDNSNGVITVNAGKPVVANVTTPAKVLSSVVDTIPGKVNEATKIVELNELLVDASDGTGKAFSSEALENSTVDLSSITTTLTKINDNSLVRLSNEIPVQKLKDM